MDIEAGIATVFKGLGVLLIFLAIAFFVAFFVYLIIKIKKENKKNDNAPVCSENALVVSKRNRYIKVTTYYITFQFLNGERKEFLVSANDYGLIAENDRGNLKYQGTRFISFVRE